MKTNRSSTKGFTRAELLLTLALSAAVVGVTCAAVTKASSVTLPALNSAKAGKSIYNWLQAYANDSDQQFPETKGASNDAYRQLFVKRLTDIEQAFAIPGDPWLKNAPGGKQQPDGKIGAPPNFTDALSPGECSWAYVTGLDAASQSNLPLFATAFSAKIGIYSKDKAAKGGVFEGKGIWVSVGGACKVADSQADLAIAEKKGSGNVNVFSKEWGTKPENVRNPAE